MAAIGITQIQRPGAVILRYGNKGMSLLLMPVVCVVVEKPSLQDRLLPPPYPLPLPKKFLRSLPKNHLLFPPHVKVHHVNVRAQ